MERDRYEYDDRQLAPYRPPPQRYDRYQDRDLYDDRKPSRPQYIRRQSSLDFDDRRRPDRYDEEERDVNVNVNFRGATDPPRRQPEPPRYDYDEEDYREVRIFRERDREVYRRQKEESSSSEEEVEFKRKKKHRKEKKAHAVFPKRLTALRAILEIGRPYTEDVSCISLDRDLFANRKQEFFYYVKWNPTQIEINYVIDKSNQYGIGYGREAEESMSQDQPYLPIPY